VESGGALNVDIFTNSVGCIFPRRVNLLYYVWETLLLDKGTSRNLDISLLYRVHTTSR
jgi:hypothetical protein